jgi:hypothetical protein
MIGLLASLLIDHWISEDLQITMFTFQMIVKAVPSILKIVAL